MTKKIASLAAVIVLFAAAAFGQTAISQTTLSATVGSSPQSVVLASTTGVIAKKTVLFVDQEAMFVNSINASGSLNVSRGYEGTPVAGHVSGARVLYGPPANFAPLVRGVNAEGDPTGQCTAANTIITPFVNIKNGRQWLCSTVLTEWVPGWGNVSQPAQPTAAVASAAGLITPSGPLFHITGALAITGFTIPVGFPVKGGQTFCVIPDGAFTTTTANNIAIASTGVVNKTLCWTYDTANAKFTPSY